MTSEQTLPESPQSKVDPADLIYYGRMTPERFFAEAQRLGVDEQSLRDPAVYDRVLTSCLISVRAETAQQLAAELNLPITPEQADNIARNSLVPDVLPGPAPLSPEERKLAVQLYAKAIMAAVSRQHCTITEEEAYIGAEKMIRAGERGLTRIQKLARSAGCLVILVVLGSALVLSLATLRMATM
jgi:hypothetical protein